MKTLPTDSGRPRLPSPPNDSRRLRATPNDSGRIWTPPDVSDSGWLRLQIPPTPDHSIRFQKAPDDSKHHRISGWPSRVCSRNFGVRSKSTSDFCQLNPSSLHQTKSCESRRMLKWNQFSAYTAKPHRYWCVRWEYFMLHFKHIQTIRANQKGQALERKTIS